MGTLVREMGETGEARALFQESLDVAQKLVDSSPQSGEAQEALADACDDLGETLTAEGNCQAAIG